MDTSAPELLKTKLTPPPARADRIPRPLLDQKFSASLELPLILVCAPAGYGKTTLVSEWMASDYGRAIPFAWLSLDDDDNDPGRFLTYVVSAVASTDPQAADDLLSLLRSAQPPPPKAVMTALIAFVETLPQQFALVLDDYHTIVNRDVHDLMVFLLEHQPPHMHVILTSRDDPPFPLGRLRAQGRVAEIRADDLRFSQDDTRRLIQRSLGIQLTTNQINELDSRTEGWAAGLQLAALAMKGRENVDAFLAAFTGSHRFVLDYLTEEVLNRQSPEMRRFLLETSVLDRMCGPLCDALTGRRDGTLQLELIERANLFLIPLDVERTWFRYHHLFSEMMRRQLARTQPALVPDLHQRASRWFATKNSVDEAIHHAVIAQDFDFAASTTERYSSQFNVGSWGNFAIKWADQIPEDVLARYPLLTIRVGLYHGQLGDGSTAEKYLLLAQPALQSIESTDNDTLELRGHADFLEVMIANRRDNLDHAIRVAETAIHYLTDDQLELKIHILLMLGLTYDRKQLFGRAREVYQEALRMAHVLNDFATVVTVVMQIATSFLFEGHLHELEAQAQGLIDTAKAENWEHLPILGNGYSLLAIAHLEMNKLEQASVSARRGLEICEPFIPDGVLICHTILARLHHLAGDTEALEASLHAVQSNLERYPQMAARMSMPMLTHAWVVDEIFRLYRANSPQNDNLPKTALYTQILALESLRVLITRSRDFSLSHAYAQLHELHELIPPSASLMCYLEMLILEAMLLERDGRTDDALATVQTALELGEPQGFRRIFLDAGEDFIQLLRLAQRRGIAAEFITKLLEPRNESTPVPPRPAVHTLDDYEQLSARELEVLELIAQGASNREIADSLVVSIGTVKKHLNNIFLKLDAHSRTQAVSLARRLRLLT
ncbi:MAG: hypothetical protein IPM16_00735 [Chloroflexi bacterium]|nr:hypothetical protein [Chloroflexota bacterium]